LYGERDCAKFSEAWIPLAYIMAISRGRFNWGSIISKQLITNILQAQTPKDGEVPTFHMALYLLDVICTRNVFTGMNMSWYFSELPVHVYFRILWENRYKKSYSLICDEFIARVYFIIFKREFPRLSIAAKKIISSVGQWYLEETNNYIKLFGTTNTLHILPTHVPNWLIMGEIYYQTILQGYNSTLVKDKKEEFIPYSFHVGF
jgi:hypothetical protein